MTPSYSRYHHFWGVCALIAIGSMVLFQAGCQSLSSTTFAVADPAMVTGGVDARKLAEGNFVLDSNGQPVELTVSDQGTHQLPPTELNKISLPLYRIEPPDILLIQALRTAPKPPYFVQTLDILQIVATGTNPDEPIAGLFQVEPNGSVNLGPSYGYVKIEGLSIQEAAEEIKRQLSPELIQPEVAVSLQQPSGQQLIAGEHLVGQDGYINLGKFGSVYVAGKTIDEAKAAVEEKLSEQLDKPLISLDVFAYNSKVYYIITEGAGFGDRVFRIPITGNDFVLDAVSQVQGFQRVSNPNRMWISRPAPHDANCRQILPIDWEAIAKGAQTGTNYQIFPGDRVYIAEDRFVALEQIVFRLTQPIERMLGFSLLGGQTIQNLQRFPEGFRTGF